MGEGQDLPGRRKLGTVGPVGSQWETGNRKATALADIAWGPSYTAQTPQRQLSPQGVLLSLPGDRRQTPHPSREEMYLGI